LSEVAEVAIITYREKKSKFDFQTLFGRLPSLPNFQFFFKLSSVAHVILMLYIGLRDSYFLRLKYVPYNFVKFLSCYCAKKKKTFSNTKENERES